MAAAGDPYTTLLRDLAAGKRAAVYYLCGEAYPRDRLADALRRSLVGGALEGFNFDALRAKDAGVSGILAAVRTVPMLGGQRLVQVRDADALTAEELAQLIPYLENPSPFAVLLLLADKADLRAKFFQAMKKQGVLQRFEPLRERQAAPWVAAEALRTSVRLQAGAAERLASAVGTEMGQLASALERVALYVGEGAAISADDVEEVLADTRQRSIFELTNAVGHGRRREALAVLRQLVLAREPGVRIVVMLARHLRQVWAVKELTGGGSADPAALAAKAGVPPFAVADLERQAQRLPVARLAQMHEALREADRALKSSRLHESVALEQLVFRLCPAAVATQRGEDRSS